MTTRTLPTDRELARLVDESLGPRFGSGEVTVLGRTEIGQGSFPKEVIRLAVGDREVRVFSKYEGGFEHSAHGHRGGVAYEARVYQEILLPGGYTTPEVVLAHRPPDGGDAWLVVEFLADAVRVSKSTDPHAMSDAAAWIGDFHRRTTGVDAPVFVTRYDRDYYMGWLRRTDTHVRAAGGADPWWSAVLTKFEEHISLLDDLEPSLLHGEYYPKNVLWSRDRVSPVDWESVAFGAGVIDLVSLVDGWKDKVRLPCTQAYARARWPNGSPVWFDDQRTLAEMYVHLRWLGESGAPGSVPGRPAREWPRMVRMRELAGGLGWA